MKWYRGGDFSSDFNWQPLSECLIREEERGNEDTRLQVGKKLIGKELTWQELIAIAKEIPLLALWVSHSKTVAARYGEAREINAPNFRILADDGDNGRLIAIPKPLDNL